MPTPLTAMTCLLLASLAAYVTYTDVRYRRIPNACVLAALAGGLLLNTAFGGLSGLLASLAGFALGLAIMFVLHLFGTMGAGDVKLFAAVGAVIGVRLVLPALAAVAVTGLVLAVYTMVRARAVRATTFNVLRFFFGLLPGQSSPRFAAPSDRRRGVPYGVAITLGSLVAVFLFRA
jgi:prepilin peptidase CpaA